MKRILYIMLSVVVFLTACQDAEDFLDGKADTALNEQKVFSDSTLTMRFLVAIYQDVGFSFIKGRWSTHGNTEHATDDAEYNFSGPTQLAVVLYNGTVSPLNSPFTDFWNTPYTNIRRVNLLLSKLPETPLSPGLQARTAAEARFLRAWYYHWLLITYGGVPIVYDNVYGINDLINLPRNSYAECIDYVVSELDEVAAILPERDDYPEQDYGRATKGACLALKSRILLHAASPLFNGGAETTDPEIAKIVSYPNFDISHWQAAADAAEAVINSGTYSLHKDNTTAPGYGFFDVFLKRVNNEYIFAFHRSPNRDMEGYYNPPSRGGAKYSMPSHNLVEAFPMANGLPIQDPASGYNPNNPYANREPRFYYSIIHNEAPYYLQSANAKRPVYTHVDAANDGFGATTTGYYGRKMCDDNISANSGFNTERGWPLMRYAEILLNYAEAVNETGQIDKAYERLIELRDRAGIQPGADNLYGLKPGMTKEEMREVIRNERRIELAFEDHRWNDIRRWKIAMTTNNAYNKCMKITKTGTTYTYEIIDSQRRHNFRPEMYLLPIPDSEIRKMPAMVQNPGW